MCTLLVACPIAPSNTQRIGHRHAVIDDDVVPDEEPVPARLIGDDRKVDQHPGLRVQSEVREVEAESHPVKVIYSERWQAPPPPLHWGCRQPSVARSTGWGT